VFAYASHSALNTDKIQDIILSILRLEGDVFALKPQVGVQGSLFNAIVEYCDRASAVQAVAKLHGLVMDVSTIVPA